MYLYLALTVNSVPMVNLFCYKFKKFKLVVVCLDNSLLLL